jgi:hypothetical protein
LEVRSGMVVVGHRIVGAESGCHIEAVGRIVGFAAAVRTVAVRMMELADRTVELAGCCRMEAGCVTGRRNCECRCGCCSPLA